MGKLYDALTLCSTNLNFIPKCVYFFSKHTEILSEIVKHAKGGKFAEAYTKKIFSEVKAKLNDFAEE